MNSVVTGGKPGERCPGTDYGYLPAPNLRTKEIKEVARFRPIQRLITKYFPAGPQMGISYKSVLLIHREVKFPVSIKCHDRVRPPYFVAR